MRNAIPATLVCAFARPERKRRTHTARRIESRHRSPGLSRAGRESRARSRCRRHLLWLCAAPAERAVPGAGARAGRLGRPARERCLRAGQAVGQHALRRLPSARHRLLRVGRGRAEDDPLGAQARHPHRPALRRPLLRRVLDDERRRCRRHADEARARQRRGGHDRGRRAADRRLRAARRARRDHPGRLVPDRRDLRPDARRRLELRGPEARPYVRQRRQRVESSPPTGGSGSAAPASIPTCTGPAAAAEAGTSGS